MGGTETDRETDFIKILVDLLAEIRDLMRTYCLQNGMHNLSNNIIVSKH